MAVELKRRLFTLRSDRRVKGRLYAEAGIPEYWIINLRNQVIEIYTDPVDGTYRRTDTAKRGETLPLPVPLQGTGAAADILGPPGGA